MDWDDIVPRISPVPKGMTIHDTSVRLARCMLPQPSPLQGRVAQLALQLSPPTQSQRGEPNTRIPSLSDALQGPLPSVYFICELLACLRIKEVGQSARWYPGD